MDARLPFVDAHVHLWDLSRIHYPWLAPPFSSDGPNGSVAAIARNYLLDDYLADACGWDVRGIVHVDAGADASAALDETAWLQGLADAQAMPNAIVAFAALDDPAVEPLLERHAAHPNVRGIRHIVNWHQEPKRSYSARDVTRDAAWGRGFGLLARYGLSFDLQCYPRQMPALAPLLARNPDVQVIVNHMGMPIPTDADGLADWRTGLVALAALPQVSIKISGMGFAYRPWSLTQVEPLVLETIDIFGTDRCMFASDFPTDKLFGGFDQHLDAYALIVASFSDAERRALFGRNANRIYRLSLDL